MDLLVSLVCTEDYLALQSPYPSRTCALAPAEVLGGEKVAS